MKINYGLIALQHVKGVDFRILHFCGYEEPPTDFDKTSLMKELKFDPEFGLINEEFIIIEAEPRLVKEYSKMINGQ
jgi:hypothetical protein